jgi:uncharacterized protein YlxW (UPF0749 family)
MKGINEIYKRIWELKTQSRIKDVKAEIQKLQQSVDSAEKRDKTNSAKFENELERYLYKRDER